VSQYLFLSMLVKMALSVWRAAIKELSLEEKSIAGRTACIFSIVVAYYTFRSF
jgi:hypothetical protein